MKWSHVTAQSILRQSSIDQRRKRCTKPDCRGSNNRFWYVLHAFETSWTLPALSYPERLASEKKLAIRMHFKGDTGRFSSLLMHFGFFYLFAGIQLAHATRVLLPQWWGSLNQTEDLFWWWIISDRAYRNRKDDSNGASFAKLFKRGNISGRWNVIHTVDVESTS